MDKKELTKIYRDYNLTKKDVFSDKRGFTIVTRSGVEKIQLSQNIKVEFEVICCSLENVVIKSVSFMKDADNEWLKQIETFGSASIKNCRNHFLVEVAEKAGCIKAKLIDFKRELPLKEILILEIQKILQLKVSSLFKPVTILIAFLHLMARLNL